MPKKRAGKSRLHSPRMRKMLARTTNKFLQNRERFERSHHIMYTFLAGVGLIMFWYGIWEGLRVVPVLGEPVVAILVGAGILLFCGAYAYQFVGDKTLELRAELSDVSADIDKVVDAVEDISGYQEGACNH